MLQYGAPEAASVSRFSVYIACSYLGMYAIASFQIAVCLKSTVCWVFEKM